MSHRPRSEHAKKTKYSRSWTSDEVESLKAGMQEQMERTGREDGMCWDWRAVSAHVPTRSAKQVHEKWLNDFMPGLMKNAPWSDKEDYILAREHSRMGARWRDIVLSLPGRGPNHVKNRFNSVKRRVTRTLPPCFLNTYVKLLLRTAGPQLEANKSIRERTFLQAKEAFRNLLRLPPGSTLPGEVKAVQEGAVGFPVPPAQVDGGSGSGGYEEEEEDGYGDDGEGEGKEEGSEGEYGLAAADEPMLFKSAHKGAAYPGSGGGAGAGADLLQMLLHAAEREDSGLPSAPAPSTRRSQRQRRCYNTASGDEGDASWGDKAALDVGKASKGDGPGVHDAKRRRTDCSSDSSSSMSSHSMVKHDERESTGQRSGQVSGKERTRQAPATAGRVKAEHKAEEPAHTAGRAEGSTEPGEGKQGHALLMTEAMRLNEALLGSAAASLPCLSLASLPMSTGQMLSGLPPGLAVFQGLNGLSGLAGLRALSGLHGLGPLPLGMPGMGSALAQSLMQAAQGSAALAQGLPPGVGSGGLGPLGPMGLGPAGAALLPPGLGQLLLQQHMLQPGLADNALLQLQALQLVSGSGLGHAGGMVGGAALPLQPGVAELAQAHANQDALQMLLGQQLAQLQSRR